MSASVAGEGAQPVATVTPPALSVQQGQRAEFRCTVTGNPTPAVEWISMTDYELHSFESSVVGPNVGLLIKRCCCVVTGGPGNRMSPRAVIRGGVLTFTAVDPADQGEYICKALNTHGEHTASVSLLVQSTTSHTHTHRSFLMPGVKFTATYWTGV